jgi:exonuclease SbcD
VLILHVADLHLADSEREYSFSVLEEIVTLAQRQNVTFLLLSGDTFDSFGDAESLRGSFRRTLEKLGSSCEVLFLPGNHEEIGRGNKSLGSLDLGPITLLDTKPFSLISREGVEFLAIPHQPNYSDYSQWKVSPKQQELRVALAHGVVLGMSFAGLDQETGAGAIDPDMFSRFQVDYAALGHIHQRRRETLDHGIICYPGSSRVWRRGELDERGAFLLNTAGRLQVEFLPLNSAGQYREYDLALNLEGKGEDLSRKAESWSSSDWVHIKFSGLVEEEGVVASLETEIQKRYRDRVRRLEIDREEVSVLPGIASQPLARRFLTLWEQKEPEPAQESERRIWLRARELALAEMKRVLEARE